MFGIRLVSKKREPKPQERPLSMKELINKQFREEMAKNPVLMRKVVFKEMGYESLLEQEDPLVKKKDDIKSKVVDLALSAIDSNPEMMDEFVRTQMEQIIGPVKTRRTSNTPQDYGDDDSSMGGIRQTLETLDDFEELRKRLGGGGGNGILGGLVNADTINEVLKTVRSMRGESVVEQGPRTRTYIVNVNGEAVEIDEPQYREMLRTHKLLPVSSYTMESNGGKKEAEEVKTEPEPPPTTVVEEVPPEPPTSPPPPPEPAAPKEELDVASMDLEVDATLDLESVGPIVPPIVLDNLDQIIAYLIQAPEDLAAQLRSEVDEGSITAPIIIDFLSTRTYEEVCLMIEPYRSDPQIGDYVNKILSDNGRAWFEQVVQLLNEETIINE